MPISQIVPGQLLGTTNYPAGAAINQPAGQQGEAYVGHIHGNYYNAAKAGLVFQAQATARTVPVVAANMASVFSVYNPIGSGKVLELISADIGVVLATTVVDVVGLHYEKFTTAPTYTAGTETSTLLGSGLRSTAVYATALTHVAMGTGAAARATLLTTFGAVTSTADNPITYYFDGKILVPAGVAVSFAVSTTVWTTSGMDLGLCWVEWPA
jgi:hypothetical protein